MMGVEIMWNVLMRIGVVIALLLVYRTLRSEAGSTGGRW
jgi:hypothetical protein